MSVVVDEIRANGATARAAKLFQDSTTGYSVAESIAAASYMQRRLKLHGV